MNFDFTSNALAITVGISVIAVTTPALASPTSGWEAEPLRYWPISEGFDTGVDIDVDASVDGTSVLFVTDDFGPSGDQTCQVAVADDHGAIGYSYRYDFLSTRCIDAIAHPDGGLFVRGEIEHPSPDFGDGFTARIDTSGEVLWTVDDRQLIEAAPISDGPGEFSGDYAGAASGLAYDESGDALMALTLGSESLADTERSISQVHVIDADSGQLQLNGQTFGAGGGETIVDFIDRDGEFLVHTVDDGDEPQFYSYQTDRSVQQFNPADVDWSMRRVVAPLAYRPQLGTFILWVDESAQLPTAGLLRVQGLDSPVFDQTYEPTAVFDGQHTLLGEPIGLWVGEHLAAIELRSNDHRRFIRFVDVEDGTDRGAIQWDESLPYRPVSMSRSTSGELMTVTIDPTDMAVWEFGFSTGANTTDGRESTHGDEGCRTVGSSPISGLWLMVALVWWLRRRHFPPLRDCQKFGGGLS